MKEILQRLKAETPQFFKDIINISLSITALSGLLLTSGIVFPESVVGFIAKAGMIAGICSAFVAKLTTIYGLQENKVQKFADTMNPDTKDNPKTKGD